MFSSNIKILVIVITLACLAGLNFAWYNASHSSDDMTSQTGDAGASGDKAQSTDNALPTDNALSTEKPPINQQTQATEVEIQLAPLSEFSTNQPDTIQNSFHLISDNRPKKQPKKLQVHSLSTLKNLFDSLNYNTESWQTGNREVPRLTFETVTESWQKNADSIPVAEKKMIFFRLMAPLILMSNEKTLLERRYIELAARDDNKLLRLARKYRLIDAEQLEQAKPLTDEQYTRLLNRVDIVPPSLVLAQAAEESGWATSRFTVEGNAFFGQWDFSGNGMAPKQQRTELGNYGIARFDSPLDSVLGYLININTNNAYQKLRDLRATLRQEKAPITGLALATTLDKYSERGQDYIDGLTHMIRFNKLDQVDEAYLSDDDPIHLMNAQE